MTGDLFDAPMGRRLRDEGVDRAARASGEEWQQEAFDAIVAVAAEQTELHADDVWLICGDSPSGENRAWAAPWRKAITHGIVTKTGIYRNSTRKRCHCRPCPVYRSLIRR
jgi:hypothetical protein